MRTLILGLLFGLSVNALAEQPLRIAVASNFKPTLEALLAMWQERSHTPVTLSSGPSGALTQQILHGAPFDLFLSADESYPQTLAERGRAKPPVTYARGQLMATCRHWAADTEAALARANTLALANIKTAPYGRAGAHWLSRHGQAFRARQVQAGSVASALQFVASGNADCALVAASFKPLAPELHWYPLGDAPVLIQAAALVKNSPQARAFLEFLLAAPAQALIVQHGYLAAQ